MIWIQTDQTFYLKIGGKGHQDAGWLNESKNRRLHWADLKENDLRVSFRGQRLKEG